MRLPVLTWALSLLILGLGVHLQSQLLLNQDASWLLHGAKMFLSSGSYTQNFFEINPPMIMYLNFPVVGLMSGFGLDAIQAIQLYFFSLGLFSWCLCSYLLSKIFKSPAPLTKGALQLLLALILFVIPLSSFAQREHLLLILVLPYFLLLTLRFQKVKVSLSQSLMIGLLAGLGFCIKPYFFLSLAAVEVLTLFKRRQFTALLRPELLMIVAVTLSYLAIVVIHHPDYLGVIVPIASHFYYQRYGRPLLAVLVNEQSLFCLWVFALTLWQAKPSLNPIPSTLSAAAFGFYLAYLIQKSWWYYHFIPVLALVLLLQTYFFTQLIQQSRFSRRQSCELSFFMLIFLAYLYFKMSFISISLRYYDFRLALSLEVLAVISALITQAYLSSGLSFKNFMRHPLSLNRVGRFLALGALGVILFFYPAYKLAFIYNYSRYYDGLYQHLITLTKPYYGHKIAYMTDLDLAFPAVYYNHQNYSSRFLTLLWIPKPAEKNFQKALTFYAEAYAHDLQILKPEFVMVDTRGQSSHKYFGFKPTLYLPLMMSSAHFQKAWSVYHLIKTEDCPPVYRFDVYQRQAAKI